jgi:peptidoglycan/LPS O-acetylase OafA/YrhL
MIKENEFPNYFIAGDNASLKAQKTYITYVRWDLILMSFSALLAIYNFNSIETKKWIYIISGIILMGAFIISLVIKNKKYEDIWYRGRALAESVKTLTWRYMTKSEYFEINLDDETAQKRFIERIKEIKDV